MKIEASYLMYPLLDSSLLRSRSSSSAHRMLPARIRAIGGDTRKINSQVDRKDNVNQRISAAAAVVRDSSLLHTSAKQIIT